MAMVLWGWDIDQSLGHFSGSETNHQRGWDIAKRTWNHSSLVIEISWDEACLAKTGQRRWGH